MKCKIYISYFLLLCFSVILGHNLVPHHHHAEILADQLANDCPFEHADHHEHDHSKDASTDADKQPLHCHAFNDVVFELNKIKVSNEANVQVLSLLFPGQLLVIEEASERSHNNLTPLKFPWRSSADLDTRGLRGPPALG